MHDVLSNLENDLTNALHSMIMMNFTGRVCIWFSFVFGV